jgi:hypothetical protein
MDVRDVKSLAFSGHTLNVAERALLSAAIVKKGLDENLSQVAFWGKLFGKQANYLVVVGNAPKFSGVPSKKFFYLTSGGENPSAQLAECEYKFPELAAKDAASGRHLEGAPETVLREADEDAGQAEAYTEAHLLAHMVAVSGEGRAWGEGGGGMAGELGPVVVLASAASAAMVVVATAMAGGLLDIGAAA